MRLRPSSCETARARLIDQLWRLAIWLTHKSLAAADRPAWSHMTPPPRKMHAFTLYIHSLTVSPDTPPDPATQPSPRICPAFCTIAVTPAIRGLAGRAEGMPAAPALRGDDPVREVDEY